MVRRPAWERSKGGSKIRVERGPTPANATKSKQVVFKVAAFAKTSASVGRMMGYIAERSEHLREPETLHDQDGNTFDAKDIDKIVDSWDLKENKDNLSRKAREATPDELRKMPEQEVYNKRQASHFVVSFPKGTKIDRQTMDKIASEALKPFSDAGFKFVYAKHMDADNPHFHVVIACKNSETGRSLRLDREDLQKMRELVAQLAREHGIEVKADRRPEHDQARAIKEEIRNIEREKEALQARKDNIRTPEQTAEMSARIRELDTEKADLLKQKGDMAKSQAEIEKAARRLKAIPKEREKLVISLRGVNPTSSERSEIDKKIRELDAEKSDLLLQKKDLNKARPKPEPAQVKRKPTLLERQAPIWYDRNGAELEIQRAGVIPRVPPTAAPKVDLPPIPSKTAEALKAHFAHYENPEKAERSFLEMAAEDRKLAFWYANKRPEVFGPQKDPQTQPPPLRDRLAPIPEAWVKEAGDKLREAAGQEPEANRRQRVETATAAKSAAARLRQADQETTPEIKTPEARRAEATQQKEQERVSKPIKETLAQRLKNLLKRTGAGAHERPDEAKDNEALKTETRQNEKDENQPRPEPTAEEIAAKRGALDQRKSKGRSRDDRNDRDDRGAR